MNLLMIIPGGLDPDGPKRVIPVLEALVARLSARHAVQVVSLRQFPGYREYPHSGARVFNLGYPVGRTAGLELPVQAGRLLGVLRRSARPVDLVHAFWIGNPGILGLLASRRLGVPLVATVGGGEIVALPEIGYGGRLAWGSRLKATAALRRADAVTAGSPFALASIRGARPDAQCIPLFPEPLRFAPSPAPPGPPWRLLTVSTVNRVKDPVTLLGALRLVADRIHDVHLDWVGEDILEGEARRLAKTLDLDDTVTFHGFEPNETLARRYAGAHLYVQASRFESQGVSVCEAAAAGLALVGTEVGLLADLAPERAAAVPVGDPGALAEAIVRLLRDPGERRRLGEAAAAWAAESTADTTAESFDRLYRRLAGTPS